MTPAERSEARRFLLHSGIGASLTIPAFVSIWSMHVTPLRLLSFLLFCALLGYSLGYYYCLELLESRVERRKLCADGIR